MPTDCLVTLADNGGILPVPTRIIDLKNVLQVPLRREALGFVANSREAGVKCVAGSRLTGNKCSAKDQRAASERLTARW